MQDLEREISSAAKSVAREWPGVIEYKDAIQEIWVHLLARPGSMTHLEKMDEQARHRSLRRIGHQVASEYRSSYEVFSGNVYYGTKEVRRILDKQSSPADQDETDLDTASPLDTPGSETHTEQIDLQAGLSQLYAKNEFYAKIIYGQYFYGKPYHKDKKGLQRAVDALTQCMNSAHKTMVAEHDSGARKEIDGHSDSVGIDRRAGVRKDVLADKA